MLFDVIEGKENELAGGADTGYEDGSTSGEAAPSVIDNDEIDKFRSGIWISFGVSDGDVERLRSGAWISFEVSGGGDDIENSCPLDSPSSVLR